MMTFGSTLNYSSVIKVLWTILAKS